MTEPFPCYDPLPIYIPFRPHITHCDAGPMLACKPSDIKHALSHRDRRNSTRTLRGFVDVG